MSELMVCPWCGKEPTVEPWHGGGPRKTAVVCDNEECVANPMVTGETKAKAIEHWNSQKRGILK